MNIDGEIFYNFLYYSLKEIEKNKESLNEINLFPVKDKDTGDNIYLTLKHALESIRKEKHLGKFLEKFSSKLLETAQGNSGNIIALFFYKLYEKLKDKELVNVNELRNAFKDAYLFVKYSLPNPKEGTILSSMRALYEEFTSENIKNNIKRAINRAMFYLKKYKDKIETLKNSKVLDAGGLGFVLILKGWLKALGEDINIEIVKERIRSKKVGKFCINLLIEAKNEEALKKLLNNKESLIIQKLNDKTMLIHYHDKSMELIKKLGKYAKIIKIKYSDI